ncbi:MAG: RDD family protein [Burkholderiaceae bacterium]|nr:RDD family protein [Burkholderiaceae bacterium]
MSALAGARGPRPAGPWVRLAAMTYDAVLLFGVVFIVTYALLALLRWTHPLTAAQRWVLQGVLVVVIGAYFVYCWTRSGQTLAMKSWGLRLVGADGRPPRAAAAVLRYVLAWHLLLPGALWYALAGGHTARDVLVAMAGAAACLLLAYSDPARRLLHDRASGTRLMREN